MDKFFPQSNTLLFTQKFKLLFLRLRDILVCAVTLRAWNVCKEFTIRRYHPAVGDQTIRPTKVCCCHAVEHYVSFIYNVRDIRQERECANFFFIFNLSLLFRWSSSDTFMPVKVLTGRCSLCGRVLRLSCPSKYYTAIVVLTVEFQRYFTSILCSPSLSTWSKFVTRCGLLRFTPVA